MEIGDRAKELGEILGNGIEFPDDVWDSVEAELGSLREDLMPSYSGTPEDREEWNLEVLNLVADEVAEIARSIVINELLRNGEV